MYRATYNFTVSAVIAALLGATLVTGCSADKEPKAEENVDLSQATGIFDANLPGTMPVVSPETVIVKIGDKEIKQQDVNDEVDKFVARMGGQVPPERLAQMRQQIGQQVVDSLIIKTLLENAIAEQGIQITDEEVDAKIKELLASFPGEVTMDLFLEKSGTTEDEFRADMKENLKIEKLFDSVISGIEEPSEEELQAIYDERAKEFEVPEMVSASHILIGFDPQDDEQSKAAKRAKAEEILKKLKEGADFASLAAEESSCPSKARGGDLGTFPRGQMVPAFEEAAFSQTVGEVGDIVETKFGYHIIKVTDKKAPHKMAFDEVKERLAKVMLDKEKQTAVQNYIEQLKADAKIEYPEAKSAPAATDKPVSEK